MEINTGSLYDKFRGDYELIKKRLEKYLKYFSSGRKILDLGCGRGEFLELLKENKYEASGIDFSDEMIKNCLDKGFKVINTTIEDYLKNPGKSMFDGIMCSHIVEHFYPEKVIDILSGCETILNKNGILIIISPNPLCLEVMSERFWLDPSHVRPYPIELLKQLIKTNTNLSIIDSGEDLETKHKIKNKIIHYIRMKILGSYFSQFFCAPDIFVVCKKE
jgi:2-polyprenyl-3-methyl-5-hydroxy-6-metoxy-1,4-benzoquinol methylase